MKKIDIERMQRLEEIVDRQTDQIAKLQDLLTSKDNEIQQLMGANKALSDIIDRQINRPKAEGIPNRIKFSMTQERPVAPFDPDNPPY